MSQPHVCSNPAECCKELSRVWAALNVVAYTPGQGSCSEQVAALRGELARLTEERDQYARGCNEWNEKFEAWRAEVKADAESALSAQQAQIEQLMLYVQHTPECPALPANADKFTLNRRPFRRCTCGLSALLILETPS